jgi:hypothetical protein
MYTMIREGGWPMWFVLAFGLSALVTAAWYALQPSDRLRALAKGFGLTTALASIQAVAADIAAVGHNVPSHWEQMKMTNELLPRLLLQGLAECMAPAILGFSMVTLVALLYGIGRARVSPSA